MFAKWIQSYRDLPLLINQWANVVRWEMRTRLFLRTTEILWQEGHTAHATAEEAMEETQRMLRTYEAFAKEYLAIPVIVGEKTPTERFPGAEATYCIEAITQDRKALQNGTSHFLGQNFAKASQIKFRDADGSECFAWTTSWGVTTRLIGSMIMTHSDDDGLVLPPRIASAHLVIIPVIHKEETRAEVMNYCRALAAELRHIMYDGKPLVVILDERDMRGGDKVWSWINKGIPLRVEIGPRDITNDQLGIARRDKPHKETTQLSRAAFVAKVAEILEEMQNDLYQKALAFRETHTHRIDTKEEFYAFFTPKNKEQPEIHGGFAYSHWCGDPAVEAQVKEDLGVTIRCIPLDLEAEEGSCVITGKKSKQRVIYAKAY
jgi:prolyl-tRNA synthetase